MFVQTTQNYDSLRMDFKVSVVDVEIKMGLL